MPLFPSRALTTSLLLCALSAMPLAHAQDAAPPAATPPAAPASSPATPEEAKAALLDALDKAKGKYTAQVRAAHLKWAKLKTAAEVKAAGKELPKEFLTFVDKDPIIEATLYGARPNPTPAVMKACSLWLDLGPKDAVKYKQLLLAAAVCDDRTGPAEDLSPRAPLVLDIPAAPTDDQPLAKRDPLPSTAQLCAYLIRHHEYKFDGSEDKAHKEKLLADQKQAAKDKEKERLAELQRAREEARKNKGKAPVHAPKAAEPAAEPVRKINSNARRQWPMFDLENTPWPLLTPLLENRLPLREADGIWREFLQTGTVTFTEGVVEGPSPFGPGSWQDLRRKEGTNPVHLALGRDIALGIPSMMGKHYEYAAICHFSFGKDKSGTFVLIPHSQMGPYMPQECEGWSYGPNPARGLRLEFWKKSLTFAMNRGLKEYLDSSLALDLFLTLPEDAKKKHGEALLASGLALNPFNVDLAAVHGALPSTPVDVVEACNAFENALAAAKKNGAPAQSDYSARLLGGWAARIGSMPIPTQKADAAKVLSFLKRIRHPDSGLRLRYQAVAEGATAVWDKVDILIDEYLDGQRTPAQGQALCGEVRAAVATFTDAGKKAKWLEEARAQFVGKEDCLQSITVDNPYSVAESPGAKPAHPQVVVQTFRTDPVAELLAELSAHPLPPAATREGKYLDKITEALKKQLTAQRTPLLCQTMACQIKTLAKQIDDKPRRDAWLKGLATLMKGNAGYCGLVAVKESGLQFPEKILDDETDKLLVELLNGARDPENQRIEKALKQATYLFKLHVAGKRTGGSCAHMAQLVPALAGQIHDEKQKTQWLKDLSRIMRGREDYRTTATGPRYRDPTADALNKLLGAAVKALDPGKKK